MSTSHKLRERFTSFWSDSAEHHGKPFAITGMIWMTEEDGMNPEPRFDIEFDDGSAFEQAGAEELFEDWATPDRETPAPLEALAVAS